MKSGKGSTSLRLKTLIFTAVLACIFVYANVTAETGRHKAEVSILPNGEFLPEFIRDIAQAKKSIYIAIYMFKSYSDEMDGAGLIKRSLIDAAERGVDVFIILDRSEEDGFVDKENTLIGEELSRHGVNTAYDSLTTRTHSKCAVIDGHITYIGSHNYTNSALKYNNEVTARIVSEEAAEDALRHIRSIK